MAVLLKIVVEVAVVVDRSRINAALLFTLIEKIAFLVLLQIEKQLLSTGVVLQELLVQRDEATVGYTVRHAGTAPTVLVATLVEVSHDATARFATFCCKIELRHLAERMIRVVCEGALVMQRLIVSVDFFHAAENLDIGACVPGFFALRQVVTRVDAGCLVCRGARRCALHLTLCH